MGIAKLIKRASGTLAATALIVAADTAVASAAALQDPGGAKPPPGVTSGVNTLLQWAKWFGYTACVIGIIMVAIGAVVEHRRGGGGNGFGQLGTIGIACILIGVATRLVNALAT